ncbi:two-component sensor histidine kinase, partial [Rhizobium ruizarguesonis]
MPRLFWKFFTTIWLTMAATVGVIFLLVNFLQGVPFARELEEERRAIALNLTANVLARDGEDAAAHFVRTSEETLPSGLTISKTAKADACAVPKTVDTRSVQKDGVCYQISLPVQATFTFDNIGPFIPWLAILISSTI